MLGHRAPKIADIIDRAFEEAETKVRALALEVSDRIIAEKLSGIINQDGVDFQVELAIYRTSLHASGVPKSMLKSILTTLHTTIRTELSSAGIEIAGLPA